MAADIEYEPQVLRTMAGVLYERAASIQLLYTLFGMVLGLLAGGVVLGTVLPHTGGLVTLGGVWGDAPSSAPSWVALRHSCVSSCCAFRRRPRCAKSRSRRISVDFGKVVPRLTRAASLTTLGRSA